MFDHELGDSEYDSAIISGIAVLGLDTDNKGWAPAESFTLRLSAIVTITRAMVVYTAYSHRQKTIRRCIADGLSEEVAKEEAPSVFDTVRDLVQRFMTLVSYGGKPSPMDRILHMRTYGMKIRYTTKGEGRISWQGDRICVDKISFTMDDIRSVVHGLHETMRQRLWKDILMVGEEQTMPPVDLQRLFDNAAEMAEGWSFLRDTRNEWGIDGERWMWDRMNREEAMRKRFRKPGSGRITQREEIV